VLAAATLHGNAMEEIKNGYQIVPMEIGLRLLWSLPAHLQMTDGRKALQTKWTSSS
jgi:hypothetical protein